MSYAFRGYALHGCCGGAGGYHLPGCEDAAEYAREQAGETRCTSCRDWFTGSGECPECLSYEAEEAAWEARQALTAAREGRP